MRKTIIAIMLALALVLIPVGSALAATSQNVTVTANPVYLAFTVEADDMGTDWPINGLAAGDGLIRPNTTYFANPLDDEGAPTAGGVLGTECWFTFDNDSNVDIDIYCMMSDFVVGGMTNSAGGYTSNGATAFGASGYFEGGLWDGDAETFPKVAYSAKFIDGLDKQGGADEDIKWGIALLTQDDDFASADSTESTVTCTAVEAGATAPTP